MEAKSQKQKRLALSEHTFGKIAHEMLVKNTKEGLAEPTMKKKRWMLDMANIDLRDRPITEISSAEVLSVLRKVEAKGNYESARRLRSTIGQVFRYVIATARTQNDPTFGLRGALIAPKTKHHAAFTDWEGYTGLLRAIWGYEGNTMEIKVALKLMAILNPRPGELRQARWGEFDLDAKCWTIPKERMKMRREHVKPLPEAAVDLLRQLKDLNNPSPFVFPSPWVRDKPLSENTLTTALLRMGFSKEDCCAHGFRSSASSLLNESGKWNADAIEAELAHMGADEVRRAYHRATYWDERVEMTKWWATTLQNCCK